MAAVEDIMIQFKADVSNAVNGIAQVGTAIKNIPNTAKNAGSRVKGAFNDMSDGAAKASKSMGMLSNATSMMVGMIGYDLVSSMTQSARASINAAGQLDYFSNRLGMSKQELTSFKGELDDMQKQFRKVDMTAVGATATELGVKLGLPKSQMGDLTKLTGVLSSAFIKEGRTQEDAILAVSDAMDGQFKRLQEIGITRDKLMASGWNGDINDTKSLMDALNKTMDDMGFTQTAQDITSLDDAWQALNVAMGQLLASVLIPLTPYMVSFVDVLINVIDEAKKLGEAFGNLPSWQQLLALLPVITGGFLMLMGAISNAGGFFLLLGEKLSFIINPLKQMGEGINFVKDKLSGVGSSISGFKSKVTSAFDNLKSKIDSLKTSLSSLKTKFKSAFDSIKTSISNTRTKITEFFNTVKNSSAVNALKNSLNTLKTSLLNVKTSIMGVIGRLRALSVQSMIAGAKNMILAAKNYIVAASQTILNAVMAMNPIFLVVMAIAALIAILAILYNRNETVRNTINAIADAVKGYLIPVFEFLQGVLQQVISWFSDLGSKINSGDWSGVATQIMGIFSAIPQAIGGVFSQLGTFIMPYLQQLWAQVSTSFWNGVNMIVMSFVNLPSRIIIYFNLLRYQIAMQLQMAVIDARLKASNIVNGIISFVMTLPARVGAFFTQMASRIRSAMSSAVNNAKTQARNILNNIVNTIKTIPSQVGAEIGRLGGIIKDKLVQAGINAFNGAKHLVAQFLAGMGIASPGTIQRKTALEFASLPSIITDSGIESAKATVQMAKGIIGAWDKNMDTLQSPNIQDFIADVGFGNKDGTIQARFASADPALVTSDFTNQRGAISTSSINNQYSNISKDDHTTVYHIDKITLECGDLTQAQSRQVLYNALDGLYPAKQGGV